MNKFALIKSIKRCDSLIPTRVISAFPFVMTFIGVLILFPYYYDIRYVPVTDFSSFINIVGYAFIAGTMVLLTFSAAFMIPGLMISYVISSDKEIEKTVYIEKNRPTNLYFWLIIIPCVTSLLVFGMYVFWRSTGWLFLLYVLPIIANSILLHRKNSPIYSIIFYNMFSLVSSLLLILTILVFFGVVGKISNNSVLYQKIILMALIIVLELAAVLFLPIFVRAYGGVITILSVMAFVAFFLVVTLSFGKTLSFALVRNANIGNYNVNAFVLKRDGCLALQGMDDEITCNIKGVTVIRKTIKILSSLGAEIYIKYRENLEPELDDKIIYAKIKTKYYVSSGVIDDIPAKK